MQRITRHLVWTGPATAAEIAADIGEPPAQVRRSLRALERAGRVERRGRQWAAVLPPTQAADELRAARSPAALAAWCERWPALSEWPAVELFCCAGESAGARGIK